MAGQSTPKRKIAVQQYRPRAQEFLQNLNSIPIKSLAVRRTEPIICDKLRAYLNGNLKQFHEIVLKDIKRINGLFVTTASDKLADAIAQVKTATETVIKAYAKLADEFAKQINEKCVNLGSVDVLSNVNLKIEQLRAAQTEAAKNLADLPEKYEKEMQSNYVTLETIIGTAN